MRGVFEAADMAPQDYDWYVSDIETNWKPPGFCWEDQWFTGNELATLLHAHEVRFIWAVFSAVPKGFRSTPASAPYVDNNPRYRDGIKPGPQIEGALFEIACWDSSGTIVINLPAQTIHSFLTRYPDTKPLATARSCISIFTTGNILRIVNGCTGRPGPFVRIQCTCPNIVCRTHSR
ncbi:MAG: hypothetical protein ACJ8HJ_03965 [Massilia sp.]